MPLVLNPHPDVPRWVFWFSLLRDDTQGGDKVMDVAASGRDDGTRAQTWSPNGADAQKFVILPHGTPASPDAVLIVNAWGRVLDCGVPPGEPIAFWGYHGRPVQRWRIVDSGQRHPGKNTPFFFVRSLDGERVLDVKAGSKQGGAALCTWESWGGPGQLVDIVSVMGQEYQQAT